MKDNKSILNEHTQDVVFLPSGRLAAIEQKQEEIFRMLESMTNQSKSPLDYISEKEAMTLLGRRPTWFWKMRKAGLKHTKVGAKVYYKVEDLNTFLSSDFISNSN